MARGEGEGEGIEEGEGVARRGWHAVGGGLGGGLSCKARGRLRARRTAPEDDAYGTRSGRRRCESPSGDVTPLVGALSFVLNDLMICAEIGGVKYLAKVESLVATSGQASCVDF